MKTFFCNIGPILCAFAAFQAAAQTSKKLTLPNSGPARISIKEVSEPQGPTGTLSTTLPTTPVSLKKLKGGGLNQIQGCQQMFDLYVKALKDLHQAFASQIPVSQNQTIQSVLKVERLSCDDKDTAKETNKLLLASLKEHSGKIGVLLPLSGAQKEIGEMILKGINISWQNKGKNPLEFLVIRDSLEDPLIAQKQLADLVLNHNVSAVIGAISANTSSLISAWAEKLYLPFVSLSGTFSVPADTKQTFSVFPTESALAALLAEAASAKNFKRVAILRPQEIGSEKLVLELQNALAQKQIQADLTATYLSGNYQSMEDGARKIFRLIKGTRGGELASLVIKMKKEAKEKGYGFNPDMVVLPPVIDFDALFIPDNFKTVRHFVQILKFLGVPQLTLFGNHQWRSPGLVNPYDPFLDGAFFADFIGNYNYLPRGLVVRTSGSPYFVNMRDARTYDYNLVGLHGMDILAQIVSKETPRYKLSKGLRRLELTDSGYFAKGKAFDKDKKSVWPAFLFTVRNEKIDLTPYPFINMTPVVRPTP